MSVAPLASSEKQWKVPAGDILPGDARDPATCGYDRDAEVEKHVTIADGRGAAATAWLVSLGQPEADAPLPLPPSSGKCLLRCPTLATEITKTTLDPDQLLLAMLRLTGEETK